MGRIAGLRDGALEDPFGGSPPQDANKPSPARIVGLTCGLTTDSLRPHMRLCTAADGRLSVAAAQDRLRVRFLPSGWNWYFVPRRDPDMLQRSWPLTQRITPCLLGNPRPAMAFTISGPVTT